VSIDPAFYFDISYRFSSGARSERCERFHIRTPAINSRKAILNSCGHVFWLDREFVLVQSVVLPPRCSHIRKKRPNIALEPHRSLCPNRENLLPLHSTRAGAARCSTGHDPRRFHENSASRRNPITVIRVQLDPTSDGRETITSRSLNASH